MLRFIRHKIRNKKWLNMCLLIGTLLTAAVFSCMQCFKAGSLDRMIYTAFQAAGEESGVFPAILSREGTVALDTEESVGSVNSEIDAYENKWLEYLEPEKLLSQRILHVTGCAVSTSLGAKNKYLDIGMIPDLEDHIDIVKGTSLSEADCPENVVPCYIDERLYDRYGLVTGEILSFNYCLNDKGEPLEAQVAGIIRAKDEPDNFWHVTLSEIDTTIYLGESDFDHVINHYSFEKVFYEDYMLLDYTGITGKNAEDTMYYLEEFQKNDKSFSCNFMNILQEFRQNKKSVITILLVLLLPVLVLLLLFIYMVSGQILTMEQGEIAMLKSRGVNRKQVIKTYLIQSLILSAFGVLLGLPVGYFLCKLAASTDAFFVFAYKDVGIYRFTWEMIPFAVLAGLISVLFMTIPVFKMSKLSIVEQKQALVYKREKVFWEKYFLDIILLILSLYLLYNYNNQKEAMALAFIEGKSFDPLVFLDASLFTLTLGLFFLRLSGYLVRLIFRLGKKRWKPAMYASFLQIQRTAKKQGFISVFLVMTIAMGIFYSNLASTINQNHEERITYNVGADVRMMQDWNLSVYRPAQEVWTWAYKEPDVEKLNMALSDEVCSMTKVIEDRETTVKVRGKKIENCYLMGINTKEFGETAYLKDGLNDSHWYNALNSISQTKNGVIISRNMAEEFEIEIGDQISFSRYNPIPGFDDEEIANVIGKVSAIVDAFPGYERYSYVYNEDGEMTEQENYLVVANYTTLVDTFGMTPYSIWMRLKDGVSAEEVYDRLDQNGIGYSEFDSISGSIEEMKNSSIIQITNGMLTVSFLISILVCTVGFLIYWILSIRQRELLFGIYRAMGMSMGEVNRMLVNEHIYSSFLALLSGAVTGVLTTVLFGKLLALVYLPQKHNVPLTVFVDKKDVLVLFGIILAVFLFCLMILRKLIASLKIAQALKMGED